MQVHFDTTVTLNGLVVAGSVVFSVLLAVWRAPDAKDLGNGKTFIRTDAHQDDDNWKGCVAMVAAMGPTAFVSGYEQDENGDKVLDAAGNATPIMYPQAPKIGDWVFFSRGYGVTVKINDFPCILVDKETEALKIRLPWPHAVDLT